MDRKRITVPADQIKRRCICRQCGQERYDPDTVRGSRDISPPTADREDAQSEHIYPHPDTWEP